MCATETLATSNADTHDIVATESIQKEFADLVGTLKFNKKDVSIKLGNDKELLFLIRIIPVQNKPHAFEAEFCAYKHSKPVSRLAFRLVEKNAKNAYHTDSIGMRVAVPLKAEDTMTLEIADAPAPADA